MDERGQVDRQLRDLMEIIHFTEKVSAKIHGLLDEADIYRTVKEEFAKSKRYAAGIFLLTEDDSKLALAEFSLSPERLKAVEKATGLRSYKSFRIDLNRSGIYSRVARDGETLQANANDIIGELFPRPLAYLISKIMGYGKEKSILTPLYRHGKIIGVLTMTSTDLVESFIPSVRNLAQHIATALELADHLAEQRRAEDRIRYLNEVLRAIRNVNQLIAREGDRDRLLKGVCELFIETKGYYNAWVACLDEEGNLASTASAGLGDEFNRLVERMKRGELPTWMREALQQHGVHVIVDPASAYTDGRLTESHGSVLITRLEHGGRVYGLLAASVPEEMVGEEEKSLFQEVALDIAYALSNLELEKARKRAERELRIKDSAIASSINAVALADLEGNLTYVNGSFLELWGCDEEETLGKPAVKFWQMEEKASKVVEALRDSGSWIGELVARRKDGSTFDVQLSASMVVDEAGKPICMMCSFMDITERRKAEQALKESEERYRKLFEEALDAIFVAEADTGILIDCNRAACDLVGREKSELIGKHQRILHPPEMNQGEFSATFKQHLEEEEGQVLETQVITKKGEIKEVAIKANTFEVKGKKLLQGIFRDITERKRTEEALLRSEEEARRLLDFQNKVIDTAIVWIDRLDREGNITLWNPAAELISGYSREEVVGHKKIWEQLYPDPDYRAEIFNRAKRIMNGEDQNNIFETTIRCKDGTLKDISWFGNNMLDKKGESLGSVVVGIDITERKRYEERLRALHSSSMRLASAKDLEEVASITLEFIERVLGFQKGGIGFIDGNTIRFNNIMGIDIPGGASIPLDGPGITVRAVKTGRSQLVRDVRQDPDHISFENGGLETPRILSNLAVPVFVDGKVEAVIDLENEKLDAFTVEDQRLLETLAQHVSSALSRLSRMETLEDLVEERTIELKEVQERLLKAERLAAIGETAAMVGHDLRNPLQAITNAVYILKQSAGNVDSSLGGIGKALSTLPEPIHSQVQQEIKRLVEEHGDMIRIIDESVNYANKIVTDLRDYSRPLKPQFVETSLRQVIDEALSSMTVPENVEISVSVGEDLTKLMVDPAMMKRVLTNLLMNALQAMPDGGRLTIRASTTEEAASIGIRDTGVGIPEENLPKLFQPLFTTRARGTGLGLAVCRRLVEAQGGTITVESQVGMGSTFTVQIPLKRR